MVCRAEGAALLLLRNIGQQGEREGKNCLVRGDKKGRRRLGNKRMICKDTKRIKKCKCKIY